MLQLHDKYRRRGMNYQKQNLSFNLIIFRIYKLKVGYINLLRPRLQLLTKIT
ncbi:hypothetical protein PEDI_46590 [Persicobacter diffluens]|uniref:Uncharacterized protein n=1 Tax=Persicobacter diffluens TaxID=981 RepID=A0AAN5AMS8_9BACT|nr:hypothetical protein PEDI_46590 [Persicobacter diffluens]